MDSHQIFGYRVAGADSSYSSSHPTAPTRQFGALKFETKNSPTSPFSTHFNSETFTTLSDSQEQRSSTDNHSGTSPSSLEDSSSFHQLSLSFLHNASSGHSNIQYILQDIEKKQGKEKMNLKSFSFSFWPFRQLWFDRCGGPNIPYTSNKTVVSIILCRDTAKEILSSSDFADRPVKESAYELFFRLLLKINTGSGFSQGNGGF